MLSEILGHKLDAPLTPIINKSFLGKVSPAVLTFAGLSINFAAAGFILDGHFKTAAVLILFAGVCDILDGATARTQKKDSLFGGFLDSVVDRYSDMLIFVPFIIYYALKDDSRMAYLCAITCIGAVLVPYTRARAEMILKRCNVGFMERAERIILVSIGCFFNIMEPIFWVLAVCSHLTVLQRIYYTNKEIRKQQIVEK